MPDDRESADSGSGNISLTRMERMATEVNQMFAREAIRRFGRVGRDPQRITVMLALLRELWEKNPDMRFGQLIGNIYRWETSGSGIEATGLMNIEDDEFQKRMTAWH